MVKRYTRESALEFIVTKPTEIYECPDCAFAFDAMHEVDDEEGGYECPICELVEETEVNGNET